MRSDGMLRRFTSFGLAALVLVSSLTCMTVACRVVCAAEGPAPALGRPAATAPAGEAALPPCHRAAPGGSSTAPASAGGGCDAGTVCCSTWLQDRDVFVMPAPVLVRERLADDAPALLPSAVAWSRPLAVSVATPAFDPPDPRPDRATDPHAARPPPAA